MDEDQGTLTSNKVYNIREKLETRQFLLQEVSHVLPEDLGDGVFVFHNPYAKNELPHDLFKNTAVTNFEIENNELMFYGNECPINVRINTPLLPDIYPLMEIVRRYNRLSVSEFYDDVSR